MPGYFLDTSALVKLYHQEPGSPYLDRLLADPSATLLLSRLALVELESALCIKVRTGEFDVAGLELARRRLRADLAQGRLHVGPVSGQHYRQARQLLADHGISLGLRTLDALQLAVALDLHRLGLVSVAVAADLRFCRAAEAAGCPAINPADPLKLTLA